jgi:hypothetical protein
VLGRDRLDGRDAVRLGLSFDRAEPLFPFLRIGGAWRPFFDRDRVQLWLDASSWIPLRILVTPSASPERRGWELRYGLGVEAAGTTILDVRLTSVSAAPPDPTAFRIPGGPASPTPVELDDVAARLGYVPATPGDPGDLELASVVLPTERSIATPSSLLVYAQGLDYLKVGERRDWAGAAPFGPIDEDAQQVSLGGGGVAYYEPAGEGFGRRLAIHGTEADLFLETNLPRERLLEIAASLPVVGRPIPGARSGPGGSEAERVTVDEGIEAAGLPASFPAKLPSGYVVASAELTRSDGEITAVTLLLRQAETDMAGPPLTLHVRPGAGMPPASSSAQVRLVSDGVQARWTPSRSELEWVEPDGYRSLQGDRTLADLLSIARVLVSVSG